MRDYRNSLSNCLERLQNYPDAFVSFRNILKVGINPKPLDKGTPIGIYAFPIKCIHDKKHLGIFGSLPYIYIIQPKTGTNILELTPNSEEVNIYKKIEEEAWEKRKIFKNFPGLEMTKLLRKAGYDAIIDWGTGTISFNERCQAVFLGIQAIDIIDMFKNPNPNSRFYSDAKLQA